MTQSNHLIVECAENCGNSPKKELLKSLSIAFAKNEIDSCIDCMRDDVVWNIIGDQQIQGIDRFEEALHQRKYRKVEKLQIHNIITHGNSGSVNGALMLKGDQRIDFCDVYNFAGFGKNAKIKTITSYLIPIQ